MKETEWENIISNPDPVATFYHYWTQKEATIKAYGKGLHTPLQFVEVKNGIAKIGINKYYLQEIKVDPLYVCHLAVITNYTLIEIYQLS
jgi:4'-phosphopantetheinyl transferase